jgi:Family of unknown function (DUF6364)
MVERTTVRLPDDLLKKAKRKAAQEGRTLTSLIEDGLRMVVAENGRNPKPRRIMPRVSKATGGLRRGVTLDPLWKYQEMEDLEYVRRMKNLK